MKHAQFKKTLLTGTALVGLAFIPTHARAATVTVNGANASVATNPNASPSIDYLSDNTATVSAGTNLTGAVTTNANNSGTLTLSGASTVIGDVGSSDHKLNVFNLGSSGVTDTINGDVYAQTINYVNTAGPLTVLNFNGNVTGNILYAGTSAVSQTSTLNIAAGKNMYGNVDNSGTGSTGVFSLLGGNQTVTGTIGATHALNFVRAGANGANTTFLGKVNSVNTNFIGSGTINFAQSVIGQVGFNGFDGTINMAAGTDVGRIAGNAAGTLGTVNLLGGNQTVASLGGSNLIKTVNLGYHGATTNFTAFSAAKDFNMQGDGTVNFMTTYRGNFNFGGFDGVLNQLVDGANAFGGNYTTTVDNTGTINATGTTYLAGDIGVGHRIKALNAAADGKTVSVTGITRAKDINFLGAGRLELQGGGDGAFHFGGHDGTLVIWNDATLNGTVDTTVEGTGTVEVNPSATVNASIGNSLAIKSVDLYNYGDNATFNGTINAKTINLIDSWGTATFNNQVTSNIDLGIDSGTVEFGNGVNLTGNIDTGEDSYGTVALLGSSSISGSIGANHALGALNIGADGSASSIGGAVNANTITVTGTGTTLFSDNVTGALGFLGDGEVRVADGKTIIGAIDNVSGTDGIGTLSLLGSSTINNNIGDTNALKLVNAGANGSNSTFNGNVNTQEMNITGNGSVTVNSEVFSGVTFLGDGQLTLGLNGSVDGNIDAASDNIGSARILGNFYGDVGVNHSLKFVELDAAGTSEAVFGTLRTQKLNLVNGDFLLLLNTGGDMNFGTDGTLGIGVNTDDPNHYIYYDIAGNVTTSTAGTGTLRLDGSTTVFGTVGAGNALKAISAGVAGTTTNFNNDVSALQISLADVGTLNFGGNVNGNLDYNGHKGIVTVASGKNIIGNVDNSVSNGGTLTLAGGAQEVTGTIGATHALTVVSGGANGATTTFDGKVSAVKANFLGSGTMIFKDALAATLNYDGFDGTAIMKSNVDFGRVQIGNTGTFGTLTLEGGTQTASGTIGGTGTFLKVLNAGADGATSNFTGAVRAQTINVTGTGTINFNNDWSGNLNFGGHDGVVNIAEGYNHASGTVDTTATNTGTLSVLGTSIVNDSIGSTYALKAVNAGADGKTATFAGSVNAQNINMIGNGTLAFGDDVTGAISFSGHDGAITLGDNADVTGSVDTTVANTGTLNMLGSSTISGAVGETQSLKTVNAGADGETVTFGGGVNALHISLLGDGTLALNGGAVGDIGFGGHDGTITLASGKDIIGTIDTSANNTGTLTLLGTSTISGTVGAAHALKTVNAGSLGETATFADLVNVQTLHAGAGTVILGGGAVGALTFDGNDGIITLADGKNITGTLDAGVVNNGALNVLGTSTISGAIGGADALKAVSGGADNSTVTFANALNAGTISLTGKGTLAFNDNVKGNITFAGHDGIVMLANGKNITGDVDTSLVDTGTLNVLGTSTISGAAGATQALKAVNAGASGTNATFASLINTQTLNVAGGTVNVNGGLVGHAVFVGDGTLNLADGKNITGAVDSNIAGTGTLNILGSSSISGAVGDTNALKMVSAGVDGATVIFMSHVNTQILNILGTGNVAFNGGSTTGDITFAGLGTLTADISGADEYSNDISGGGQLVKAGSGSLTLSGANTYTGGTTISDGTVIGTTSSIVGDYNLSGGGLTFDQSTSGTYAGAMSGSGTFSKTGSGSVSLTGDGSAFTGLAEVLNGRLAFNGDYSNTDVNVYSGAILGGAGSIGNVQIASGGHFAPGNSINTINTGNVTFNNGSIYDVEINAAGQSDRINSSGTVTINGGTVAVNGAPGVYGLSTPYTIIHANAVNGTFSSVTDNLAFLDPTLIYSGNDVKLRMDRNNVDFSTVGNDPALGSAIQALGAGNPIYDAYVAYTAQQAQQAQNVLNNNSNTNTGIIQSNSLVENTINGRMDTLSHSGDAGDMSALALGALAPSAGGDIKAPEPKKKIWSQLIGTRGHTDADASVGSAKQSRSSYGVLAGMDTEFSTGGYYGFFGGYEDGSTNSPGSKSSLGNYHTGAYATYPLSNGFIVSSGLSGTYHNITSSRNVLLTGLAYAPYGETNAYSANAFTTVKRPIALQAFALEPFAGVSLNYSHTDGYNEQGGGAANLSVDSNSVVNPASIFGVRVGKALGGINVNASAGWQHTFGDVKNDVNERFVGGNTDFSAAGVPRDREAAIVGFGIDSALAEGLQMYGGYNGTLSESARDHSVKAGLKFDF